MSCKCSTTIQCDLASGETALLTAYDCAAILNAMARSRMLRVQVEEIPADYECLMTDECYASERGCEEHDDVVYLYANASDFLEATPRRGKAKGGKK